ncbi:MAG: tetratricopeptide repeat protein [Acidobacteria bacterium]|nr:tetratricopeptide repeat protein [Acidobacteriota bacterium]
MRLAAAFILTLGGLAAQAPGDFAADHRAGEALIKQGRLAEAIPHLERAAKIDPLHYANGWDLALCYLETRRLAAARRQIQGMLARGEKAELHNLLGDVEARAGQPLEAAKAFERAARLEPSEKHLHDLGMHLVRHHAGPAAAEVLREGTRIFPNSAPLRIGLAMADYATGRFEEAVRAACEGADLDPADPRPIGFLGSLLDVAPAQRLEVARRLALYAARFPRNADARFYHGLSAAPEKPDLAERELKAAVLINPRYPGAHLQLGILQAAAGRHREAIVNLQTAARLDPGSSAVHYRLGQLYQKTGQAALARETLEVSRKLRDQELARARENAAREKALVVR